MECAWRNGRSGRRTGPRRGKRRPPTAYCLKLIKARSSASVTRCRSHCHQVCERLCQPQPPSGQRSWDALFLHSNRMSTFKFCKLSFNLCPPTPTLPHSWRPSSEILGPPRVSWNLASIRTSFFLPHDPSYSSDHAQSAKRYSGISQASV